MASPAGFEPTAFRLGAHEACVKKARNIGKNVYYEKSVCATYAVDAAYAAYAGKSVVKSVPKLLNSQISNSRCRLAPVLSGNNDTSIVLFPNQLHILLSCILHQSVLQEIFAASAFFSRGHHAIRQVIKTSFSAEITVASAYFSFGFQRIRNYPLIGNQMFRVPPL